MRLGILSPGAKGATCGVADHTRLLSSQWRSQGYEVLVVTTSSIQDSAREFASFAPQWVVMQYTPQLYGPGTRGVALFLASHVSLLRRALQCKVALIAHELHYPVSLSSRGLLLGLPQRLQIGALAKTADAVFVTTSKFKEQLSQITRRVGSMPEILPVGSNIGESALASPQEREIFRRQWRHSHGLSADTRLLVHFGGAHPTRLFHLGWEALDAATDRWGAEKVRMVYLGLTPDQLSESLSLANLSRLTPQVSAYGVLPAEQIVSWLRASDVTIAPFMDGISTRRGSAMAAMANHCPIATTRGVQTDVHTPWDELCAISSDDGFRDYPSRVVNLLEQPDIALKIAVRAKKYYDASFSWPVISNAILTKLEA